jgi:hypothetical protein
MERTDRGTWRWRGQTDIYTDIHKLGQQYLSNLLYNKKVFPIKNEPQQEICYLER